MKKFEKALMEIRAGVRDAMYDAISNGERTCNYEYDFGNTTIMIEVEQTIGACSVVVPDVWIEREDCEHQSPMVIEAVKNVIPDWWGVYNEVEYQSWCEAKNEEFLMAQQMY